MQHIQRSTQKRFQWLLNGKVLWLMFLASLSLFAGHAMAEQELSLPAVTLSTNPDGSQEYSVTLQVLIFMTALSFIPAAVIMMTSFTRIVVVMAILRQAFGLQQTPIEPSYYWLNAIYDSVHYDPGVPSN